MKHENHIPVYARVLANAPLAPPRFLCRYAYALYHMRAQDIKLNLLNDPLWKDFRPLDQFKFDEHDINPMRGQIRQLIEKLSGSYKVVRAAEQETEAEEKKQRKKDKGKGGGEGGEGGVG